MEIHLLPISKLNLLMSLLTELKLLIAVLLAHLFCLILGPLVFKYLFIDF